MNSLLLLISWMSARERVEQHLEQFQYSRLRHHPHVVESSYSVEALRCWIQRHSRYWIAFETTYYSKKATVMMESADQTRDKTLPH